MHLPPLDRIIPPPSDAALARNIRDNVAALRRRARAAYRVAWWLERVRASAPAHKLRHDARLDLTLAAQQERGLVSGAYRRRRRQHPSVEEQCGCARYCNPWGLPR